MVDMGIRGGAPGVTSDPAGRDSLLPIWKVGHIWIVTIALIGDEAFGWILFRRHWAELSFEVREFTVVVMILVFGLWLWTIRQVVIIRRLYLQGASAGSPALFRRLETTTVFVGRFGFLLAGVLLFLMNSIFNQSLR